MSTIIFLFGELVTVLGTILIALFIGTALFGFLAKKKFTLIALVVRFVVGLIIGIPLCLLGWLCLGFGMTFLTFLIISAIFLIIWNSRLKK